MGRRHGASDETLGAKLGPKFALLVGRVMEDHIRRTAYHRAKIGAQAGVEFWKTVSDERDAYWAPMLDRLLNHELHPEWLKQAHRFTMKGKGEGAAMAALSVAQGAASQTIFQVLNAELAPFIHHELSRLGTFLFDPSTSASLAAHGIITPQQAADEAGGAGFNGWRAERLMEAAEVFPDFGTAVQLYRRGKISFQQYIHWMRRGGIASDVATEMLELHAAVHSPEDLAVMVLKGIKTEQQVREEASASGINAAQLHDLVLMSGEPPGLEQLAEYYRREFIDEERFRHGVRESRVKDEWFDVILKARFQRASPSDALRGVIQHHLSDGEGKKIAEENGLDPRDWKWLVETEGNPAAPMEMISLWRRGKTSRAKVEQAIREGRTKNKYIPDLTNLKRAIPSLFQITKLLASGGISEKEGTRLLHELGYESDVVSGIVHASAHSAVVKDKQLAKAEVLELFYDQAIDEGRAEQLLKVLGYSPANSHLLILLVNLKREKALRQAAMSPIRSAFIARHIDRAEASKQLDGIGVPHPQRDFALAGWSVDREAHRRLLTEAQIVKANEKGLLSDAEAEKRLLDQGYNLGDARILLDLEKERQHAAP